MNYLPSVTYRSKPLKTETIVYRLYYRESEKNRFVWWGESSTIEGLKKHMLDCGEDWVIKRVKITYEEDVHSQCSALELIDRVPELKGVF